MREPISMESCIDSYWPSNTLELLQSLHHHSASVITGQTLLGVEQELGTKILQAALALHDKVASTFRKTAINFHYEFTVRHLANVFQGLLMSTPEQFNNPNKLSRLWLHESERVYADRLVSQPVRSPTCFRACRPGHFAQEENAALLRMHPVM